MQKGTRQVRRYSDLREGKATKVEVADHAAAEDRFGVVEQDYFPFVVVW